MTEKRGRGRPGLFTSKEICKIRDEYWHDRKTLVELGTKYEVTHATISYIVNRKTYRNVVCK